ncbi:YceI family protein [Microbacterium album]|uniref:Lipid/polyisoprenoid-binding YceI-like domain-containing protein n=1 Tax=Microbacterium album TaxID=2053191 RepID=A0A917MMN6_9MICO|nr:YceI family protein [Microbacterium album]GGH45503.1 hypothetical protein GCM10010921_20950 [Microbacterium album]
MSKPAPRRRLSRATIVVLAIVAALVLVGGAAAAFGPAFYRDVIVGEAPAAPAVDPATAPSAPAADEPLADLSGTWTVASGSYAGYRVDEVLNGTDVTVVGRTEDVTGEVRVDGLSVARAEVTVDVGSIATDAAARDAYFRDQALSVREHPTATFRLTEPIETDAAPEAGESATVDVRGELTLNGVTRAVSASVDAAFDGRTAQVAGSVPITFADFGVEAPDLGFVSVEPDGFVEFLLLLEKR